MITIYKEIIKKYIHKLTKEDIKKYAKTQNENLTNNELQIIHNYIINNYNELLNKDTSSFVYLKQNLRKDLFNKIEQLYNNYKNYI